MELKDKVIAEIKKIYDPEIPVNIYDLGLIYNVKVDKENVVEIKMTLTTPNCPVAESLPKEERKSGPQNELGFKKIINNLVGIRDLNPTVRKLIFVNASFLLAFTMMHTTFILFTAMPI